MKEYSLWPATEMLSANSREYMQPTTDVVSLYPEHPLAVRSVWMSLNRPAVIERMALPEQSRDEAHELPNPIRREFVDRLDPDFVAYYNAHLAVKPAVRVFDFAEIRADANNGRLASPWCKDFSGLSCVNDRTLQSADGWPFAVRIYSPDEAQFGPGPFPVHVNFHGAVLRSSFYLRSSL